MKNIRIIATILLVIAIALSMLSTVALGTTYSGVKEVPTGDNVEAVDKVASLIMNTASIVCYVAAVILIMWMGIKYMTSAPEGKAEMKKSLSIAAVASVLLVGTGAILGYFKDKVAPQVLKS